MKEKIFDFLKKNKVNVFIVLFTFIVIVCNTVARADSTLVEIASSSEYPSISGTVVEDYITDDCSVFLVHYYYASSNYGYYLYVVDSSEVSSYLSAGDYGRDVINVIGDYSSYHIFNYSYVNPDWFYYKTVENTTCTYSLADGNEVLASSFDIYTDSSYSELFFQQTPLYSGVTVAQLNPQQIITLMMNQIIGLLPLVIGLVLLVIALKKGLTMLYQRLKKS